VFAQDPQQSIVTIHNNTAKGYEKYEPPLFAYLLGKALLDVGDARQAVKFFGQAIRFQSTMHEKDSGRLPAPLTPEQVKRANLIILRNGN